MSSDRETRLARRHRRQTSDRIAAEAATITYCTVTGAVPGIVVTIAFEGTAVDVPLPQIYAHRFPVVGDRVVVNKNGSEVNIVGIRPATSWTHFAPHLYVGGSAGTYSEIGYGSGTVYRDAKYRISADGTVKARYMLRLGSSPSFGTTGYYFAMTLPFPAVLDLGDDRAEIIGIFRAGHSGGFDHIGGSVHTGRVFDDLNTGFCYFVPDGAVALANNTRSGWANFHLAVEYGI